AKIMLGTGIHPLLVELVVDLIVGWSDGTFLISPTHHQNTDALFDRSERTSGLADLHRQHDLLERWRKVTKLDLVALDHFAVELRGDLLRAAASADILGRLGELLDHRLSLLLGGALRE